MKLRTFLLTFTASFGFLTTYAQENYMTTITRQSCECIEQLPDSISSDALTMKLGICMLNAAMPYKEELKRDYGIDYDRIAQYGERLGQIIGIEMASECPESLLEVTSRMVEDEDSYVSERLFGEADDDMDYQSIYGKITAVDEETFYVITVKEQSGKTTKMYWMDYIDTELPIHDDPKSMIGQSLTIYYFEYEFYDLKLKEYRNYKVIQAFE